MLTSHAIHLWEKSFQSIFIAWLSWDASCVITSITELAVFYTNIWDFLRFLFWKVVFVSHNSLAINYENYIASSPGLSQSGELKCDNKGERHKRSLMSRGRRTFLWFGIIGLEPAVKQEKRDDWNPSAQELSDITGGRLLDPG